jgi:hypothetical protein
MAVVLTAMYDAWAAYDDKAVGTRLGASLRRAPIERTQANKEKAIAFAAYRALLFVYPEESAWTRDQFSARGHDPNDTGTDPKTPQGVGKAAAEAVIAFRRQDGSNQFGDAKNSDGKPYSDTTGYQPVNTPDKITEPLRWLPIPFSDGKGGTRTPGFLTPHWGTVKPFAMERADEFRPPPPPAWGSQELVRDIEDVVAANATLTLEQKTVVEFMREGPRSTGQSGHWLQFAQDVSRRDRQTLDQDVKLFFTVGSVVADAFISCWEGKRHYDTGRPCWFARVHHKGQKLRAWLGPGKGTGTVAAEQWRPYSPDIFSRRRSLATPRDTPRPAVLRRGGWNCSPAVTASAPSRCSRPVT